MFFKDDESSGVMALEWNREEKGPIGWVVFLISSCSGEWILSK